MSEEKKEKRPILTEATCQRGLACLNLIYTASLSNLPTGLAPAAKEAQLKALQEAGQGLVDIIQEHGPADSNITPVPENG